MFDPYGRALCSVRCPQRICSLAATRPPLGDSGHYSIYSKENSAERPGQARLRRSTEFLLSPKIANV